METKERDMGNTGHSNTGSWNPGNSNTGDCNTGYWNSGDCNTGSWNAGNWNTGHFNSDAPDQIRCFNNLCSAVDWDNAEKPKFIFKPSPTTWVPACDMSDQEKAHNTDYQVNNGYLRVNDMSEEWMKAYEGASEEDIQKCRNLPNFDYDVFEEITGLDIRPKAGGTDCTGKIVEIDGVKYKLSRA